MSSWLYPGQRVVFTDSGAHGTVESVNEFGNARVVFDVDAESGISQVITPESLVKEDLQ